jgi:GT2 family glycosyltransferase
VVAVTALLVIGNGRTDMLARAVVAAETYLPDFDHLLMVNDSGSLEVRRELDDEYPDFLIEHHSENLGMAAAVQAGFDLVLSTDARWVFWLEEDMILTAAPPIDAAVLALESAPDLAQMCFRRDPADPSEQPDQLTAICGKSPHVTTTPLYTVYDFLFSMGPCIIPRHILEYGWPAGPIGVGNEDGMTKRLLEKGYRFGSWGHPGDGQSWGHHMGYANRGKAWQL